MENRFRLDGTDLGVDLRSSFAVVDATGVADGTIVAARPARPVASWSSVAPRLVISRVPLRFDGETFGALVDDDLRDRLFVAALATDGPDGGDADDAEYADAAGDDDADDDVADDLPAQDPGVALLIGSRHEATGRLTHLAGDRLRFVGDVALPGGAAPLRLDVSLDFGGRRRPAL